MPEFSYKLNAATERSFLRQILADPLVLPRVAVHLRPSGLADPEVRELVVVALRYWRATQTPPTGVALLEEVRRDVNAGKVPMGRIAELATVMEEARDGEAVDSDWIVARILQAEREDAVWQAIQRSISLWQAGKYDEVIEAVRRADAVGRGFTTPGMDYSGSLARRTEQRVSRGSPPRWGTGIRELDDVLDGGLSIDNPLGLVLGPPKGGKSQFLGHVALYHMATGGFVVYFTLEMGEGEIINRQDAAISLVPIREVHKRAAEVRARVDGFLSRCRGGMHVKFFPGGAVTCARDLDLYLEELRLEQSVRPSMIIVDYADEMAANDPRRYDKRHEELRAVASELRALFQKHGCVGWTASQMTKDGLDKKAPSLGDAAGAFAKVFVADAIVAIARTEEERRDEKVRLYVLGSRFSGDGEPIGPLPTAYGVGRFVASFVDPGTGA